MANKEFYRNARAYDIAFNDREYDTECDFLEWCLKKHSKLSAEEREKKIVFRTWLWTRATCS